MENFDAKTIQEIRRKAEYSHSMPGICERYMDDVEEYLKSKITGLEDYVYKEIATYCANRFTVSMADVLIARDKEWNDTLKRTVRRWQRINVVGTKRYPEDLYKED